MSRPQVKDGDGLVRVKESSGYRINVLLSYFLWKEDKLEVCGMS